MIRRLYTSLQTARTFVKKHEILSFMLVTARLFALTLVVPDAKSVVDVVLCGDTEHIGRPLRRSLTVSTSATSLFSGTGGLGHRATQFLEPSLPHEGLNPPPICPFELRVLPSLQEPVRDREDARKFQSVVHRGYLPKKRKLVS